MNKLYYGDNLDIVRRYIPDEKAALVVEYEGSG